MKDHLSQTFHALSDPTRRAILSQLSLGSANVSDLAKPFLKDMSLPAITKHLKVLESAGLIAKEVDAQYRSCSIKTERLQEANDWIDQYRAFWEQSFDRLEEYLNSMNQKKKSQKKKENKHGRKK